MQQLERAIYPVAAGHTLITPVSGSSGFAWHKDKAALQLRPALFGRLRRWVANRLQCFNR